MAALRVGSDMNVSGRNAVSADIVVGVSPGIAASTCTCQGKFSAIERNDRTENLRVCSWLLSRFSPRVAVLFHSFMKLSAGSGTAISRGQHRQKCVADC